MWLPDNGAEVTDRAISKRWWEATLGARVDEIVWTVDRVCPPCSPSGQTATSPPRGRWPGLVVSSHTSFTRGKLKYVSVEQRAESGKFRICWVILGEAVPISVELEIF